MSSPSPASGKVPPESVWGWTRTLPDPAGLKPSPACRSSSATAHWPQSPPRTPHRSDRSSPSPPPMPIPRQLHQGMRSNERRNAGPHGRLPCAPRSGKEGGGLPFRGLPLCAVAAEEWQAAAARRLEPPLCGYSSTFRDIQGGIGRSFFGAGSAAWPLHLRAMVLVHVPDGSMREGE
jgi:hypothetical protein